MFKLDFKIEVVCISSGGVAASSTNITNCHDVTEILLKVTRLLGGGGGGGYCSHSFPYICIHISMATITYISKTWSWNGERVDVIGSNRGKLDTYFYINTHFGKEKYLQINNFKILVYM